MKIKCYSCKTLLDKAAKFCPSCGYPVREIWKDLTTEQFCDSIGLNTYIRTWRTKNSGYAFGSDDYTVIDILNKFMGVDGNIYTSYEFPHTNYLGNKVTHGRPSSLKYYTQFAPKAAVEWHFKKWGRDKFAWAMLAMHLQMHGAALHEMKVEDK